MTKPQILARDLSAVDDEDYYNAFSPADWAIESSGDDLIYNAWSEEAEAEAERYQNLENFQKFHGSHTRYHNYNKINKYPNRLLPKLPTRFQADLLENEGSGAEEDFLPPNTKLSETFNTESQIEKNLINQVETDILDNNSHPINVPGKNSGQFLGGLPVLDFDEPEQNILLDPASSNDDNFISSDEKTFWNQLNWLDKISVLFEDFIQSENSIFWLAGLAICIVVIIFVVLLVCRKRLMGYQRPKDDDEDEYY